MSVIRWRWILPLLSAAVMSLPGAMPARAAAPNVILIVVDDLGAHDLGCTGSRLHQTPHLDRLASQGLRFTSAYAPCTVCSPSRAAILTGKYPARLKLTDWIKGHNFPRAKLRPPVWNQQLAQEEVTIAEHLKAQGGYATAHIGKWHLGGEGFGPETQGFDLNLGGDHRGQPPSYLAPYRLPALPDGPDGEYLTDREGDEVVRFIEENRDRPFFINYWPHAVHTPLQAQPERIARYKEKAASAPEGEQRNATYAAMLESLDTTVGRILEALERNDLSRRTLVIFTSDNGGLVQGNPPATSNAPLRSGKGSPYEGGHRVPLLVRWPGVVPEGATCDQPVMTIDLAPTILEAVGATAERAGARFDGISLASLLREPESRLSREDLYWHYPHYHPGGATPYAAIRHGDWKLIQYYEDGRHELFNLREDPAETMNLADRDPERTMDLARKLFSWQGRVGAQWPLPNPNWESKVIAAAADGSVRLHARDAFVHGETLRYEPQPFKNTLGWWSNPPDWVSWDFEVTRPGGYRLSILQGCGTGHGGSEVEFAIGEEKMVTKVVDTGGFQNFVRRDLGEVQLSSGKHTLTVRPRNKTSVAVMDLREVVLEPVAASAR